MVFGIRPTMPAKMTREIPLPMPYSVISSPNHISITVPAVRVTMIPTMPNQSRFVRTPCRLKTSVRPHAWSRPRATVSQRVQRVILRRPYSPSLLSSLMRVETTVISCMMIEALIYGLTPMAMMEKVEQPEERVRVEQLVEGGLVGAGHGDVREDPEHQKESEGEEDLAAQLRNAERVAN